MRHLLYALSLIFLFGCSEKPVSKVKSSECDFLGRLDNPERFQCGSLQVPENHDNPAGKQIEITYVIIKSKAENTELPMLYFTGGPGAEALNDIESHLKDSILSRRHIVRFDQRGIGHSSPLPNLSKEFYELMAADMSLEEEKVEMEKIIDNYLAVNKDIDFGSYNSYQNAKDVGMLMDHLGYEKYNLTGTSYGTRLARIVVDMFPEKINAAIYDSPAPYESDFITSRLKNYNNALDRVVDFCEADPECQREYPRLKEDYFNAVSSLDADPLMLTINDKPFVVNPQDAIYMMRYRLYRNDSRVSTPEFIADVLNRDIERLDLTQSFLWRNFMRKNYPLFASFVTYTEYDPNIDEKAIDNVYEELPYFREHKLGIFPSLYLACDDWPGQLASDEIKANKETDIPALIFVNQFDPVTPPVNAEKYQSQMSTSQAFVINEGGHAGGDRICKRIIMNDFMSNPNQKVDVSCLDVVKAM